jgi:hypothetical protein
MHFQQANLATRPKRKKGEVIFLYSFVSKTIFKMNFESKLNAIETTPHSKTNAIA